MRPKGARFTTFAAAAAAVDELIASQDQGTSRGDPEGEVWLIASGGADEVASEDGSDDDGDRHAEAEEEDEPEVRTGPLPEDMTDRCRLQRDLLAATAGLTTLATRTLTRTMRRTT